MSLLAELQRRNVIRVTLAYLVLGWLLLPVGDVLFEALRLPEWANAMLLAFLALGLVPVVVFSWVYELTPEAAEARTQPLRQRTAPLLPPTHGSRHPLPSAPIRQAIDAEGCPAPTWMELGFLPALGEPWDLALTPHYAERLEEASIPWPPKQLVDYPAKDW